MFKLIPVIAIVFVAGLLLGAAAIQRTIPNTAPELPPARNPWKPKDVMGLISSMGIRALEGHLDIMPLVVMETDRTFVLKLPTEGRKIHYVIVPKKDIPDSGQISAEDAPYLTDIFLIARELVEKNGLYDYKILTNGPGFQKVGYLHFHLMGKKPPIESGNEK